jgi:hypothetical protein
MNSRSNVISTVPISRAYFTDDEGKTYFEDDVLKPFPFERSGKKAYRAYVFRCGSRGTPFVGMLGRQGEAPKTPLPANVPFKPDVPAGPIEVRKPNTDKWVALDSPDGMAMIKSLCPDGRPESLRPGEE